MRIITLAIVIFVSFSCGNKKQPTPATQTAPQSDYTPPAQTYTPPPPKLSPVFQQKTTQEDNPFYQRRPRQTNTYHRSSDNRYYCENCGEVIYDTGESDEYCEDCLYEIREEEERRERAEEEGYDNYDE